MPVYEPKEYKLDDIHGYLCMGSCDNCGYSNAWGYVVTKFGDTEVFWCIDCIERID